MSMNEYILIVNKSISAAILLWEVLLLVRLPIYFAKEFRFISPIGLRMAYMLWGTVFLQAINNLSFVFVTSYNAVDPVMKLSSITACVCLSYLHKALKDAK